MDTKMSVIEEINVGTIETIEIDESQFDDSAHVHLWNENRSYCGAKENGHKADCHFITGAWMPYGRTTETECPACGVPLCEFCIFLHETNK
jgi:hypothetical protein